ncbi:MAG: lysophospholipid acyltransferase family protein [Anaerolineae bacterium]|nr:lysophospholipid acyltransferase family protein [Anaerolineae bacterium]
MKNSRVTLEGDEIAPEYAYLVERPALLGRSIQKLFELYCRTVFKIYCPLSISGRENIPNTSFMFCSNHNSHMDVIILMIARNTSFNKFGMIAAKDYWFENRIKKYLTGIIMTLIPIDRSPKVDRNISTEETVNLCKLFISNGNRNIIFFPEGTRSLDGSLGPFKKGATSFAIKLGIPIVPVYINGSHKAWPKGNLFMRPKKISVLIGEPMDPQQYFQSAGSDPLNSNEIEYQAIQKMTEDLEKTIHNLGRHKV